MTQSQLLQIFAILTPADRRALRSFVRSPFHNQREDVIRLYDFLDKNYRNREDDLRKETIAQAVFLGELGDRQQATGDRGGKNGKNTEGGKLGDSQQATGGRAAKNTQNTEGGNSTDFKALNYVMSFLDKLIRQYLMLSQLENEPQQADLLLNRALILRGGERLAEKSLAQAQTRERAQPLRHAATHLHDYQLLNVEYDLLLRENRAQNLKLQEASDAFHIYAVAEILRQACAMLAHQSVVKKTYEQPLLTAALAFAQNFVETHPNSDEGVAIKAYFHAYWSMKSAEKDTQLIHFQALKDILRGSVSQFPEAEIRGLQLLAINFCIRQMNQGDRIFEREVLALYKLGLDNRLLFENNHLTPYTYKNVMMAALKVGDNDWAAEFLEVYKPYLPDRERDNIYRYNRALYDFRQHNYPAAMQLLQGVNLRETLFNLDARRLLARIYYELGERTALDSHIESSKIYLHRQRGIGYHHDMYLNFFRTLEAVLKADLKDKKTLKILRGGIEGVEKIAEREWLLGLL
jgi:hypothetical protein